MTRSRPDRHDALAAALLFAAVLAVFGPLLNHMVHGSATVTPYTDHPAHNVFAAQMRQERRLTMPHPLYHLFVIGFQKSFELFRPPTPEPSATAALAAAGKETQGTALAALNDRYASASVTTLLLFQLLLAAVLWIQIRRAIEPKSIAATLFSVSLVLVLMLVGPIALFHAYDDKYYFGYIATHVFHSPTVLVAKPLAYLTFLGTLAIFRPREPSERFARSISLLAIVVLGALAKPSFLICLIPATLFMGFLHHQEKTRWNLLLGTLLLPTVIVILWQSHLYAQLTGGSHAKFSPLATMAAMSDHLGFKFLLSILFPVVCAALWPEAARRFRLNFAWVIFACGLALTYLIKESQRTAHGNFLWSAQLAVFVLFVESMLMAILAARARWAAGLRRSAIMRSAVCVTVLLAHLCFGLRYDIHLITTPNTTPLLYK